MFLKGLPEGNHLVKTQYGTILKNQTPIQQMPMARPMPGVKFRPSQFSKPNKTGGT